MRKPILQALLIADNVYEDKATGKKVIAGVFHRLMVTHRSVQNPSALDQNEERQAEMVDPNEEPSSSPAMHGNQAAKESSDDFRNLVPSEPTVNVVDVRQLQRAGSPYAYLSLTEVHGTVMLRLQCVDLMDNRVLFSTAVTVRSAAPFDPVEVVAPLPPLPAIRGTHMAIELLWEGELLGMARIAVDQRVVS